MKFVPESAVSFSENEKILICGDPKLEEWKEIPPFQKIFFAKAVLQSYGYHNPQVEKEPGEIRWVLGDKVLVKKIEYVGAFASNALTNNTQIIGRPLTPSSLDLVENATKTYFTTKGHLCPKVTSKADPKTGVVSVFIETGPVKNFPPIDRAANSAVFEEALQRYHAFSSLQPYDSRRLEITTRRILSDGVLASSHFITPCDGKRIRHNIVAGKPRLIRLGVGYLSDVGPFATARWLNSRMNKMASSLQFHTMISVVEQNAALSGKFFFSRRFYQTFLAPQWHVSKAIERLYEKSDNTFSFMFGRQWQGYDSIYLASLGPSYSVTETKEAEIRKKSDYFKLRLEAKMWDHNYEYHQASPKNGYQIETKVTHAPAQPSAPQSSLKTEISGRFLTNILSYSPERLIAALRFRVSGTTVSNKEKLTDLPLEFREFAGGTRDIRGFARKSLPWNGRGALSYGYLGLELRSNSLLPYGFQPILFYDLLGLSEKTMQLPQFPNFSAPGIGMRWQSPVGGFRVSYATGFSHNDEQKPHQQVHLTYGEEY